MVENQAEPQFAVIVNASLNEKLEEIMAIMGKGNFRSQKVLGARGGAARDHKTQRRPEASASGP